MVKEGIRYQETLGFQTHGDFWALKARTGVLKALRVWLER